MHAHALSLCLSLSDVIFLQKKSSNHFHKPQKYFSHITYHLWPWFTRPCKSVQAMSLTTFQELEQLLLALWQIGDILYVAMEIQ